MIPGEYRLASEPVTANPGRPTVTVAVTNTGDRPVQVGSHIHLPETNAALAFDRVAAHGFRLDIPSGTSVRFEPGVARTVDAVAFRGRRRVPGVQLKDDAAADLDGAAR